MGCVRGVGIPVQDVEERCIVVLEGVGGARCEILGLREVDS